MGLVSAFFNCTFYFFKIVLCAQLVNLSHDKKEKKQKQTNWNLESRLDIAHSR